MRVLFQVVNLYSATYRHQPRGHRKVFQITAPDQRCSRRSAGAIFCLPIKTFGHGLSRR